MWNYAACIPLCLAFSTQHNYFDTYHVVCSHLFIYYFIYLFILTALGLHCCTQAFSSCGERGLLFLTVCRLLIVVASLVAEHGL